jgi:protein-disulfide isomerase
MQTGYGQDTRADEMILNRKIGLAGKFKLAGKLKTVRVTAVAVAALASVGVIAAAPRAGWTLTFAETPRGGFIMGNPAAPNKLAEYASYTCSHCAEFETSVAPKLKAQNIAGGNVSFEIRSLVRDPVDLTMAMLARCGGKGRFFGNHKILMANQASMLKNATKITAQTDAKLKSGDIAGFMFDVYTQLGLKPLAAQRGITDASAKACFADKAAMQKIIEMTRESGSKYDIKGTPAFLLNDKLIPHAHDLASIQAALAAQ